MISVAPGGSRAYDGGEWHDAPVVVERGEVEVESLAGHRRAFGAGDVLCLAGLPLYALHNREKEAVLLVAVSRRPPTTD